MSLENDGGNGDEVPAPPIPHARVDGVHRGSADGYGLWLRARAQEFSGQIYAR